MPVDISLVMPVWQPQEPWLREAVASVLAQRGCDLELIVVDDGTPQPVADLLSDVADPRIRHLRIAHGGVSAARNAGIEAARGAYLRFVDADDVLDVDSTARLRAAASGGVITYTDTVVCDEHLQVLHRITSSLAGDVALACLSGRFDSRHVSMLFPAQVVREAGLWDTRLAVREDFDFVLRCLEKASVVPVRGTGTYYRRHDRSATRDAGAPRAARRASRIFVLEFLGRHPELRRTEPARNALFALYDAEVRAAVHERRLLALASGLVALVRTSPGRAGAQLLRSGLGISRTATARTTRRARAALSGRAR